MRILRVLIALVAAPLGWLLVLPALLVAAPFVLTAYLTRRLADWLGPKAVPWEELIQFEPVFGWRSRAGLSAIALDFNGDPFRVTTDSDGWRGGSSLDEAEVICFGDSFAFGSGIDDEHFFAELDGSPAIKAIGVPGYNLVQSYLWMAELREHLRGKQVVWLVYPANDLDDNLLPNMERYRMPFLRKVDGTWAIHSAHVTPEPWTIESRRQNVDRVIEIGAGTPRTDRVMDGFRWLLGQASDVCSSVGATLTVVNVPDLARMSGDALDAALADHRYADRFDAEGPARSMGEICEDLGANYLDLGQYLEPVDYLERDVHWNEIGHQKVARVLRSLHTTSDRQREAESEAALAVSSGGSAR